MSDSKSSSLFIAFDRSGSMGVFPRDTVIKGLMDLISKQENIEKIVLIMFSTTCEVVHNGKTLTSEIINKKKTSFNIWSREQIPSYWLVSQ